MTQTSSFKVKVQHFDQLAQRQFLKRYMLWFLLPVHILFAAAFYPLVWQYISSYGLPAHVSESMSGEIALFVYLPLYMAKQFLFISIIWLVMMSWLVLLIFALIKVIYRSRLNALPKNEIRTQLFVSSMIAGSMLFGVLTAVSDPVAWGVITAIIWAPLTLICFLTFSAAGFGTGHSQIAKYKSSVFQIIPFIALLLSGVIFFASEPAFRYMQEVNQRNSSHEVQN